MIPAVDSVYGVCGELKDYGMKTRGVKIVQKKEGVQSPPNAEFYEVRCEVRTQMRVLLASRFLKVETILQMCIQ